MPLASRQESSFVRFPYPASQEDSIANKLPPTPRPRALLVTDQRALAGAMRLALNHGSFELQDADNVSKAADFVETWRPHIVVLDLDLPGGPEAVASFSMRPSPPGSVSVIALSRRSDLKTKLAAFDTGAEDILTVPFAPEELLARAVVVTRRIHKASVEVLPVMTVGDLDFDIMTRGVRAGGHDLHLTLAEMTLLYLFAANPGEVLSRDTIANHLWGPDYDLGSNVVDVHIRNLRRKLNNSWKEPRYVFTVPGRGYQFLRDIVNPQFLPTFPSRSNP